MTHLTPERDGQLLAWSTSCFVFIHIIVFVFMIQLMPHVPHNKIIILNVNFVLYSICTFLYVLYTAKGFFPLLSELRINYTILFCNLKKKYKVWSEVNVWIMDNYGYVHVVFLTLLLIAPRLNQRTLIKLSSVLNSDFLTWIQYIYFRCSSNHCYHHSIGGRRQLQNYHRAVSYYHYSSKKKIIDFQTNQFYIFCTKITSHDRSLSDWFVMLVRLLLTILIVTPVCLLYLNV